jgi:hypothetical protein
LTLHHANHFYGHAHILARYAGLAEVPRIWGYLQHGWNVHDGFAVGTLFAPGFPKYVWSDAPRRRGWAAGLRNYVVVGSPWAYLLELEKQREWEESNPPREGTIVYPFHGWEQQNILGDHDRYVDQIKATEDGPVTICLYWNEYRVPEVRRSYEKAGFRVISHGYRGYLWKGTDIDFLSRQLVELRRHRRVVSNRLTTAIFYGASVGAEVGVYGDPMVIEAERMVFGGYARLKRLWPELHQVHVPQEVASEVARIELGSDLLLSPTELIQAFGWEHARRQRRLAVDKRPLATEGDLAHDDDTVDDPVDADSMPIA